VAWYALYIPLRDPPTRLRENPHALTPRAATSTAYDFPRVGLRGLSGLGGMCFAYSISTQFSPSIYMGYGYLAIAAMIFGNWHIISTSPCVCFRVRPLRGLPDMPSLGMSATLGSDAGAAVRAYAALVGLLLEAQPSARAAARPSIRANGRGRNRRRRRSGLRLYYGTYGTPAVTTLRRQTKECPCPINPPFFPSSTSPRRPS
jgi:hypothetical protein